MFLTHQDLGQVDPVQAAAAAQQRRSREIAQAGKKIKKWATLGLVALAAVIGFKALR